MNKAQLIIELDPRERGYGMLQISAYAERYMCGPPNAKTLSIAIEFNKEVNKTIYVTYLFKDISHLNFSFKT